jgi:hypothetical protein
MVVLNSLLKNVLFVKLTNIPHSDQLAYYNRLKIPLDLLSMSLWIL